MDIQTNEPIDQPASTHGADVVTDAMIEAGAAVLRNRHWLIEDEPEDLALEVYLAMKNHEKIHG